MREEEKRMREEEKRMREEEKAKREEEKRKREKAEQRNIELEKQVKSLEAEIAKLQRQPAPAVRSITSLDGISVTFSDSDKIRREGNRIIHVNRYQRHCFLGGEMQTVCVHWLTNGMRSVLIVSREFIGCVISSE